MGALSASGLSGWRNDSEFSGGCRWRDVLWSPMRISHDRTLAKVAGASVGEWAPARWRCRRGSEGDIRSVAAEFEPGKDWTPALEPADLVLSPAACYPVYPLAASRGPVPVGGLLFDVACDCFRHEPSKNLDRLQSFRMREYVCIGAPAEIADFRERWMTRATKIADRLGLTYRIEQASDPFFGRGGK